MTNSEQKNTLSDEKGIEHTNTKSLGNEISNLSVPFTFSKIKKNGDVLTKKVSLVKGEAISDASECRMSRGRSERVSLTLPELPEYLRSLEPNEAIATGWVNDPSNLAHHELLPKEKFLQLGYGLPSELLEHGNYSTRTKESFIQTGSSLIMFDYDHDENSRVQIESPEQFIEVLSKVIPNFDQISYVRTFSTSSAIYHTETGQCLRPADGFHIYMVAEDGSDLKDFGDRLNKRLWMLGYGHVKVSKSASLLSRTLVDVAVFSPERLIFEAGAVTCAELDQRLPTPEYVERPLAVFNTRTLKALTAKEEQERVLQEKLVKTSESTLAAQAEVRKVLVLELINKKSSEGQKITVRQAEKIVEAKMQYKLTYDTLISFESGEDVLVSELLFNPEPYDKMMCLDPMREDKGFGKVQFYANTESGNPIIHSFVEGGRIYKLVDSVTTEDESDPEIWVKQFTEIATVIDTQSNRYLDMPPLREGVTIFRSQKGTGKTYGLAKWLKERPELRVLNVTHRVSLARALGTQFQMDIYNDESMTTTKLVTSKRLSCCYDSVYKLSRQHYDVVVMDEAVQIMRHLVAETVREKFLALNILLNIIYNAKYVIMMDADFQAFHVEFLKSINLILDSTSINVVLNTFQPSKGNLVEILEDGDGRADELGLLQRMVAKAQVGGMFYASNSVKDVELKAEQVMSELGHDLKVQRGDFILEAGGRRVVIISGNNSGNSEVQEFIDHINTQLKEDDLVFCSPSMGTGVSIDSINGEPRFDEVFARFTKRAGNIPSDCIQHMSRVRDCKKTTMAILEDTSYECTNAEQIVEQRLLTAVRLVDSKSNPFHHCLNFNSWTGQYEWADSGYSLWLGFIKGMEAQERNLFGNHLKLQLEQEGYDMQLIKLRAEEELAESRKNLDQRVKDQKAQAKELEYQLRRNTEFIDDETYKALKLRKNLRIDDRRRVEKKYYAEIMGLRTEAPVNDLICQPDAKIAERVGGLILGMDPDALLIQEISDRVNTAKQHIDKTFGYEKHRIAMEIASKLGVFEVGGVLEYNQKLIDDDVINDLHYYLSEQSNVIRRLFSLSVPRTTDRQKRSQSVLAVVKRIGLHTERFSTRGANGPVKHRRVSESSIDQLNIDIENARKYSILAGFNEPKATGDFDTFTLYQVTNLGYMMPEVENYVNSLQPEVLENLNRILNFSGTNALGANVEVGEPYE